MAIRRIRKEIMENGMRTLGPIMVLFFCIISAIADSPDRWFAKAEQAHQQFDNVQALEYYLKVYEAQPDYPGILFKIVRSYIDVGEDLEDRKDKSAKQQYEQALKFAQKSLRKYPDDPQTHIDMATALGRLALFSGGKKKVGLSRDVKKHLDRALELDPNAANAHAAVGIYHRELCNLNWFLRKFAVKLFGGLPKVSMDDALEHLERAVELRPDWVFAHLELGKTLWELKKKDRARQEWQKALGLPNGDHRDPIYKAEAKKLLKDHGE